MTKARLGVTEAELRRTKGALGGTGGAVGSGQWDYETAEKRVRATLIAGDSPAVPVVALTDSGKSAVMLRADH